MSIKVARLGLVEYQDGLQLQERLLALRQERRIPDTLLLLEHPPVLTIGKAGDESHILTSTSWLAQQGISVHRVNRGGKITYHGPGQLVGYPFLHLKDFGSDVRQFIRSIEEIFIRLLESEYGILARRHTEYTGVWVGSEKITAIGFAIKRWVTMHGFAFNVQPNLEHFRWIHPCGITDPALGVTSLAKLLAHPVTVDEAADQVIRWMAAVLQADCTEISKEELFRDIEAAERAGTSTKT